MRRALPLALAALAAGCIAPAPAEQVDAAPHAEPGGGEPAWRTGPARFTFNGHEVDVPEGVTFATDGARFLYASGEAGARDPEASLRCAPPAGGGPWVLVSAPACRWASHPGVACVSTDLCDQATGFRPSKDHVAPLLEGDPEQFSCAGAACRTLTLEPPKPAWGLGLFFASEVGGRVRIEANASLAHEARMDRGKNEVAFELPDGWVGTPWTVTFSADAGESGRIGLVQPEWRLVGQPLPCPDPAMPPAGNVTQEEAIAIAREAWAHEPQAESGTANATTSLVLVDGEGLVRARTPKECRHEATGWGVRPPDGKPAVLWIVGLGTATTRAWSGGYLAFIDSTTGRVVHTMRLV